MNNSKIISILISKTAENNQLIRFSIAVLVVHFAWKLSFLTPDELTQTLFWGIDITEIVKPISVIIAKTVYHVVSLFSSSDVFLTDAIVHYKNAPGLLVIWGCSGIKQAIIFTAVILLAKGNRVRKLWYIPLGIVALHIYNITRLTILTLMNENHIEWFDFMHGKVFKVGYYVFIFMLWVLWINRLSGCKSVANEY